MKNDTQWSSQVSVNRAAMVPGSAVNLGDGVCAPLTIIRFLEVWNQSCISSKASLSALHQLNDYLGMKHIEIITKPRLYNFSAMVLFNFVVQNASAYHEKSWWPSSIMQDFYQVRCMSRLILFINNNLAVEGSRLL